MKMSRNIKKLWLVSAMLLLVAVFTLLLPTKAQALAVLGSGSCGGSARWQLTDDGVLTIYGSGAISDYDYNYSSRNPPWASYEDSITKVVVQNGITGIGECALAHLDNVTSISIPNSVVTIGEMALNGNEKLLSLTIPDSVTSLGMCTFQYCDSLQSVTLGSGITEIPYAAFRSCTSLTSVVIPEGMKKIDLIAFDDCTALTSITIPDSVTDLVNNPFTGCTSLKNIVIGENNPQYTTDAQGVVYELYQGKKSELVAIPGGYQGTYTIPDGVSTIGLYACSDCPGLQEIHIPDSVGRIWTEAFMNCTGLTGVDLPDRLVSIDERVFSGCYNLTEVQVPATVHTIKDSAFYGCIKLKSLKLGSVSSIGTNAFYRMSATIYYPTNDATWTDAMKQNYGGTAITYVPYSTGDWTWELDSQGTLTISGTGAINDYAAAAGTPWYSRRTDVKKVVIGEGITAIGASAFYECSNLTQVSIADTVTKIGNTAFYKCSALERVTLPEGLNELGTYAFAYCDALSAANLPDSLTYVGAHAFYYCVSLQSVDWPVSVTTIPDNVFYGCEALTQVTLPDSVTEIGKYAFGSCVALPAIDLPDHLLSIGDSAFTRCLALTQIELPEGLLSLGNSAFSSCSELTGVVLPESLTKIGGSAFAYSKKLTSIHIPKNVTEIGKEVFRDCTGLSSITVDENNQAYTADSCGVLYSKDLSVLLACPAAYTGAYVIPAGVREISDCAFYHCTKLSEITIADTVSSIGNSAFYGCNGLTSVMLPDSVTSLGNYAFERCGNLQKVTLGRITQIGYYTFEYCALKSITIPDSVTKINNYAFYYCDLVHIEIPTSVTSIGYSAFDLSSQAKHVLYKGTYAQKTQMTISSTGNTDLTRASWCYNAYGKITEEETCTQLKYTCSVCAKTYSATKEQDSHIWTEATCDVPKTCSICGATEGEALGHTYADATCTLPKTCSVCGATEGEALGHTYADATCTLPKTCSVCGATEGEALGHSWVDANCTTPKTCSVCKLTEGDIWHNWGPWFELVKPSCTTGGMQAHMCTVCNMTQTQPINAPGHSFETVITVPTCTQQGHTTKTCTACGTVEVTDQVDALGHAWTDWTQTKDPTCTQAGEKSRSCGTCQQTQQEQIDALGHSNYSVVTAPTCTEQGYTTNTCSVCGEVAVTDHVPAKGHNWSAWIKLKDATCTAEGNQIRFCNCGTQEADTIEMLPHSFADGVCSVCGAAEEVACDHSQLRYVNNGNGTHDQVCACGELFVDDEKHSYEDNTCVCGHTVGDLSGMTMSLGNSLAANFVISKTYVPGTGHYAVIEKAYANGDVKTVTVKQADWQPFGNDAYYFAYAGVSAKEMTDVLTVNVYNANGEQVVATYIRTIEDYCYRQILKEEKKNTEESKENLALYVDVLKYGAAAQDYFDDYNIENLATARLSEQQLAYGAADPAMTDIRVKGTGYMGATLSLKSEISMNFVFQNATIDQAAYATISFTNHYGNLKEKTVQAEDFRVLNASSKYIVVDGMAVADCAAQITVTLYAADGSVLSTTVDSVESYISRMSNSDAVYSAIIKLATSAYNYFH